MGTILFTMLIGLVGVGLFHALALPLPWLLGPIAACLVAALMGTLMKGITPVNDFMRTILGVAAGASLTPAVLATVPAMWPTLLMVPLMILCIGVTCVPYLHRVWSYDVATAYYASMPGGLQDMLVFGEEAGGNVRALSLIHATRVLVIVVALPFILAGFWGAELTNPPGAPARSVPVEELALMLACAVIGWWAAHKVGMFGASILGPLIATAIVTLAGWLQNRPPAEVIWLAQFFIGLTVGVKYSGITMGEVRRDLTAALGLCLILIVLTLIFVETAYALNLASGMEALLALAPGGQAELMVLALIVGADAAFVVAHHVLRIFTVILGAPIVARWMGQ